MAREYYRVAVRIVKFLARACTRVAAVSQIPLFLVCHTNNKSKSLESQTKNIPLNMEKYIAEKSIENIVFIIGHPDDEIMFFNQVLLNINNIRNHKLKLIHVICLTNKNTIRHKELVKSCEKLLQNQIEILKVSVYDFIDSMTASWDSAAILETLEKNITASQRSKTLIITFDEHGVSNHLNHRSCYQICKQHFNDSHLFALKTPAFALKYSSFFILLYVVVLKLFGIHSKSNEIQFTNFNAKQWFHVVDVMCNCHKSQMVWYRWLWWFSNSLVWSCTLVKVSQQEQTKQ